MPRPHFRRAPEREPDRSGRNTVPGLHLHPFGAHPRHLNPLASPRPTPNLSAWFGLAMADKKHLIRIAKPGCVGKEGV
jgi:hypothetical protein